MFKTTIDDAEMITIAMNAAPKQYQSVLTSEQCRLGNTITPLHIETEMQNHWRAVHGMRIGKGILKGDEEEEDQELTLSAFAGTCFLCKKKGHKASNCPNRKRKRSGNNNSNNSNKGNTGTKETDCWKKPEDKEKAPEWFKNNKRPEIGGAAVDGVEFVCVGIDQFGLSAGQYFPDNMKLLSDPNIWIADTGATCDMMPYPDSWHPATHLQGIETRMSDSQKPIHAICY
jgi:hypothetical protein